MLNAGIASALQVIVTNRVAYTPTLDAGMTNVATNAAFWWRIGDSIYIEGGFTISGGGGGAAETITVSLPSGLLVNTAKLSTGTSTTNPGGPLFGACVWFQQGAAWRVVWPTYSTTSNFRFYNNTQIFSADQLGDGDGVHYNINLPISGWA